MSVRPSPVLPSRFGVAAAPTQRPISIGQSPRSFLWPVQPSGFAAHQFQRADDARGARQLIEGQEAQGVAHQDRHAGAELPELVIRRCAIVHAARPR